MEVTRIVVLVNAHGPDNIILETDLPNGCWPYNGNATARIDVATCTGEEYVKKNFKIDPNEIVRLV